MICFPRHACKSETRNIGCRACTICFYRVFEALLPKLVCFTLIIRVPISLIRAPPLSLLSDAIGGRPLFVVVQPVRRQHARARRRLRRLFALHAESGRRQCHARRAHAVAAKDAAALVLVLVVGWWVWRRCGRLDAAGVGHDGLGVVRCVIVAAVAAGMNGPDSKQQCSPAIFFYLMKIFIAKQNTFLFEYDRYCSHVLSETCERSVSSPFFSHASAFLLVSPFHLQFAPHTPKGAPGTPKHSSSSSSSGTPAAATPLAASASSSSSSSSTPASALRNPWLVGCVVELADRSRAVVVELLDDVVCRVHVRLCFGHLSLSCSLDTLLHVA